MTIPAPGHTLAGRYRLRTSLGSGRVAEVFSARDLTGGGKVAVKLLHSQLSRVDESVKRFERECAVTGTINHPNTAKLLDFGHEEEGPLKGRYYLVMELVTGETLTKLLEREGKLEAERAVRIATQVASALSAAHEQNVVHRDVSPENILVLRKRGDDHTKVLDFGLARLEQEAENDRLTDVGVRLGSALYMSPEYITKSELDHRSDLYALGVLLFQMLTGRPPYVGRSMKVMQDHATAAIPRPGDVSPGIPAWLESLVVELLDKDPERRPQSAAEVVHRLEQQKESLAAETSHMREVQKAQRHSSGELPEMPASVSSVGHASVKAQQPIYIRDPNAAPTTPLLWGALFAAFAIFGLTAIVGVLALVVLL